MPSPPKQILEVLESLDESALFCTSGSVAPVLPGVEVKGVGSVGLPLNRSTAEALIKQATQAPYGRGETIVDTDVRRVWQLEPKQFSLKNPQWDGSISKIVDAVKKEFAIEGRVNCDLYKLLLYEEGSFFVPHRDTGKVDGMFATLVVCLPSRHEGSTLIVNHDGQTKRIDFGGDQSEYKIQYAAFYADSRHEIEPVTSGYRLCLVYNLSLAQRKRQPSAPTSSGKVEQAVDLLKEIFADPSRDKIAIPLKHEYSEAGLNPDLLKGADRFRMRALLQAAKQLDYHLYLSLMTFYQTGDLDYDTVSYSRRGYAIDEDLAEVGEVYDEELSLDCWIDAQGQKKAFGKMKLDKEEILCEGDFEDFPVEQSVEEATGNEGATVERWYRQAVIVIWPPDRYFRILANEGQESAVPALAEMVAKATKPADKEACRTFANEIINHWRTPQYGFSITAPRNWKR